MSTGAITFPIKLAEAVSLYSRNKTFTEMSIRKQQEFLMPFKIMDKAEEELRNLDIVNASDNLSNRLRITRRNMNIQKDFFSMFEYAVWATNQAIENDYYKTKRSKSRNRQLVFIS